MFQKCPICEGTGEKTQLGYLPKGEHNICPTCKGKRIISELTGLPPSKQVGKSFRDFGDLRDNQEQFKDK